MIYNHWIHEIVNKGHANKYLILEYPDIVQLKSIDPNGKRTNIKITERKTAQREVDKYPKAFELTEIDSKKQILADIKLSGKINSKQIKRNSFAKLKKPFRNKVFFYLSFLLVFPFFSKNIRNKTKETIDENINVIQTITAIVMIALTIWIILLM